MDINGKQSDTRKTVPVCFSPQKLRLLEKYAKKKGMTNYSQAVEHLAREASQE
jgi:hypothetical protein